MFYDADTAHDGRYFPMDFSMTDRRIFFRGTVLPMGALLLATVLSANMLALVRAEGVTGLLLPALLSGAFLGGYRGAAVQMLYLALGAVGVPVFPLLHSGVHPLQDVMGGFLVAMPFVAGVTGVLLHDRPVIATAVPFFRALISMLPAFATMALMGLAHAAVRQPGDWYLGMEHAATALSLLDAAALLAVAAVAAAKERRSVHVAGVA